MSGLLSGFQLHLVYVAAVHIRGAGASIVADMAFACHPRLPAVEQGGDRRCPGPAAAQAGGAGHYGS